MAPDRAVDLAEPLEQRGCLSARDADAGILDLEPDPLALADDRAWTRSAMWPRAVNLTALLTRFRSTCRRRSPSATTVRGIVGSRLTCSSSFFFVATPRMIEMTFSTSPAMCVGFGSSSNWPASIFEKSRMSLSDGQERRPGSLHLLEQAARLGREVVVVEEKIGEAQDRVQGRADLVAHGSQEVGLGLARLLRLGEQDLGAVLGGLQLGRLGVAVAHVADRHQHGRRPSSSVRRNTASTQTQMPVAVLEPVHVGDRAAAAG